METSQITLSFANVSGKKIEADFDGGTTTSDGGVLLLRQAEARTGIVNRLVGAMSDRRHQSYIDYTYTDLIRQRVFQIACGYEDANDSDDLRSAYFGEKGHLFRFQSGHPSERSDAGWFRMG